ncbi:MAG TPA: carbohydrate kinase family protein [Candidatus Paceibacterota bacterium]|nr:carbohydrate kinase family protein [Candidatus Paceibacterota bacterium]
MDSVLDFFAIGDIVTEPFIRLKEAEVHCRLDSETCEICMRWGDKIPYESFTLVAAVGNASNAAVAAARLGLTSALRAYIGQDRYGEDCLEVLRKEKVDTGFMVKDPSRPSNYHYVLWYETERTILVKHENYDYRLPQIPPSVKWMYLSSLADNSLPYHQEIAAWLAAHPDTKLTFQPGTFQMKLGAPALKGIYERTELFVCNKAESERILGLEQTDDKKILLDGLHALGPKIVVITDDRKGAYARSEDGQYWYVPMYPDTRPPYERTGAGDAFASSITAALALGLPLEQALLWGPVNAMCVVQEIGAQKGLLTRTQLEEYIKNAPAEFALSSL